jgi:hypothetical protein
MRLGLKEWNPISIHKVVLAWLRAEHDTAIKEKLSATSDWPLIEQMLLHPDLQSGRENRRRLRLLYAYRDMFVGEIPPDTQWHEVRNLTDENLEEIHAVNFHEWTHSTHNNELRKVAAIRQFELNRPPAKWETPILWGHDKAGPFTIFEGNKRLTAYARSGESGLDIPVFIGISPLPCMWHIFDDNCGYLLYDRWRSTLPA